jgi:hypothetical protein
MTQSVNKNTVKFGLGIASAFHMSLYRSNSTITFSQQVNSYLGLQILSQKIQKNEYNDYSLHKY